MGASESISKSSQSAFEGSKKIIDKLSSENCNGNINLTIFDRYSDLPVKRVSHLTTPTAYKEMAQNVVNHTAKSVQSSKYTIWKQLAIGFILSLVEGVTSDCTSIYRLVIEVGENSQLLLMISFSAKKGVQVTTDRAVIIPIQAACQRNSDGYSMKNLSVRPGMTWKHVSEAIDKQKKDIYSWLSHNDKDYMNKVGQDLAYQ